MNVATGLLDSGWVIECLAALGAPVAFLGQVEVLDEYGVVGCAY
jgi:hypothetical protein